METDLALKNAERTEEIQEIIDRMPTKFGMIITGLVLLLTITCFSFGWIIRYPDIVTGEITINANTSPVKLVANTAGKLLLNHFRNQSTVAAGDYIAIIENPANLTDIQTLFVLLKKFDINNLQRDINFPKNLSLGDINAKYFTFLGAFDDFKHHNQAKLLQQQEDILIKTLGQQKDILNVSGQKLKLSSENLRLTKKFQSRDSILLKNKVLTEAEKDRSDMDYVTAKDAYNSVQSTIINAREQIQETANRIQQNKIQQSDQSTNERLHLVTAYTDLVDNLKFWEQKYALKAPMSGRVQFSKFYANDQFIQAGEPVFTIVPLRDNIIGQMNLPATGAGKVKIGQEVIIKLENYPYEEYGSVKGIVSSVSLTTNVMKTDKGDINTYLVNVSLPEGLKTNYGSKLDFKYEIKGSGDIVTKDRRLLERLFDNLKYSVKK